MGEKNPEEAIPKPPAEVNPPLASLSSSVVPSPHDMPIISAKEVGFAPQEVVHVPEENPALPTVESLQNLPLVDCRVDSDPEVDEVIHIPHGTSTLELPPTFNMDAVARIFPRICDDSLIGSSEKMYSPDLLVTKSARSQGAVAKSVDDILADLRGQNLGASSSGELPLADPHESAQTDQPRRRGRPKKDLNAPPAPVPAASHTMVTRSQGSQSPLYDE